MQSILNLIRWKNLLMIALVQLLIKYCLLEPFGIDTSLDGFGISMLIIATLCIAAAGNIINDIFDIETDQINKPDHVIIGKRISEKTGYNLFMGFNIVGVGIGFYISHLVDKPGLFALFVIISVLLYIYASYLKQTVLIGNIIISVLVALSLIVVGLFDLFPSITSENQSTQLTFFKIILDYAYFAFMINFIREMVKDLEDIDGDYNAKMKTLPIIIGRDRTSKLIFFFTFVPLAGVIYYIVTFLYKQPIAIVYFLVCITAPLIYIIIKLFSAETQKEYAHISVILKIVMFFGMLSMLIYPFILK